MKGLYVHIPFCEYICHYCDFVKRVPKDPEMIDRYLVRLRDEINLYQNHFNSIDTIYIGGGTPSMLSIEQLTYLFESLKEIHPFEYTVEVNPESYDSQKGRLFKKYGINRISLGVQSFDNKILEFINRGHKQEVVESIVQDLKSIGIKNISIDLMFAIPGQTVKSIEHDLKQFLKLDVPHLSYYSLILEDKTYFYHQYLRGKFIPVDEDIEGAMYDFIMKYLKDAGYEQYEISNFAKEGHYSMHNTIYWTLAEYIGVGMGAHGFIDNQRTYNERGLPQYLNHFTKESIKQSEKDLLQDELIFGLRMKKGISISKVNQKYGIDVFEVYPAIYEKLNDGLLEIKDDYLRLTQKGFMLGNQVFVMFV